MSLLTYNELCELVENKVIYPVDKEHINAASIDVRLGDSILAETFYDEFDEEEWSNEVLAIDLLLRQAPVLKSIDLLKKGRYTLTPGEFILAQTLETFNLPNDIAAEFRLKSSMARSGLNQSLAVWCDPGWHNSVLTLELTNVLSYHSLILTPGMRIGQMIFFRGQAVPESASYRNRGSYNSDVVVSAAKTCFCDSQGELLV